MKTNDLQLCDIASSNLYDEVLLVSDYVIKLEIRDNIRVLMKLLMKAGCSFLLMYHTMKQCSGNHLGSKYWESYQTENSGF